jgi:type VI secretion system secreted protein Hcp
MSDGTMQLIMDAANITGDSQLAGYKGKIDITHFYYRADAPAQWEHGGGLAGVGMPRVSEISIGKRVCSATPKIENQFFTGKPIPLVVLTAFKMDGTKADRYMEVTLSNAFITSFSAGPEGHEEMTLVFESVKREFFKQDNVTGKMVAAGHTEFDTKEKSTT